MPLGYETAVVNGQMITVAPQAAYDPLIFGPAFTGPGMWNRQGVYNVPPMMPSGALQSAMTPSAYGQVTPAPTANAGNPFHPTKSPLPMALLFLVVGVLMLQYIHYK
jgi:hypothetical protein